MAAQALLCPNCGGTVEIRGMQHTKNVVCVQCLSILNASTPALEIIQRFEDRMRVQPLIPMGTRGKMHGVDHNKGLDWVGSSVAIWPTSEAGPPA